SIKIEGITKEELIGKSSDTLSQNIDLHKELFRDFLKRYEENDDFPINGEDGIKSLELIKAIYLSSAKREVVRLPLNFDIVI
ncbi:gfo/Idh/MocA family oxidoreductase, partial [Sulfolobus sp. F3]